LACGGEVCQSETPQLISDLFKTVVCSGQSFDATNSEADAKKLF
jgi:hypothetical protein